MDILQVAVLSAALSFDAFGIGSAYALRGRRISIVCSFLICTVSAAITALAVCAGKMLIHIIPAFTGNIISFIILFLIGLCVIAGTFRDGHEKDDNEASSVIYEDTSDSCNEDSSGFEISKAFVIGALLSVDSLAAGAAAGMSGGGMMLPLMCGAFQMLFLCAGVRVGKSLFYSGKMKGKAPALLSGIIMLLVGISRLIQ